MSELRSGGTPAPTVLRMILGTRLKELRRGAGVSLEDAARALRVKPLTVRRLEKAEVALRIVYVEKLLHTYGVGPRETDEFLALAEQANRPGWWHSYRDVVPAWFTAYVSLETDATVLRTYEPQYVTGLLQTPDSPVPCCGPASPVTARPTWRGGWNCACAVSGCWTSPIRPRCGW
jgi:transcriptional regulator with XRE-family HTH domain